MRAGFVLVVTLGIGLHAASAQEPTPLPPPVDEPAPPIVEQAPPPPPAPDSEEPIPARPPPSSPGESLSWPGAVAGLGAALAMQAGVCTPLALIGCAMTAGPVLFFTQGAAGNACWMLPLAGVGALVALALAVVGPLGGAVIVGSVHDMTVGGHAPLFTVAAVSVAATWLGGLVLALPVLAASALTLLVVGPTLQQMADERARARQTGFSSAMLGLWAGSTLLAMVLVAVCAVLFVVGSAVPVFLADVLTRAPGERAVPVKKAPRIKRRRRRAG